MNYFNPLRSRASAEGGDEDPDSSQNDSQDIHASKHAPSSDTPMQSPNDPPPSQKATSSQQPAALLGHQVRIMFKHNVRRVDYIHSVVSSSHPQVIIQILIRSSQLRLESRRVRPQMMRIYPRLRVLIKYANF